MKLLVSTSHAAGWLVFFVLAWGLVEAIKRGPSDVLPSPESRPYALLALFVITLTVVVLVMA